MDAAQMELGAEGIDVISKLCESDASIARTCFDEQVKLPV